MLPSPKKNFGFWPTHDYLIFVFLGLVFLVIPIFLTLYKMTVEELTAGDAFWLGARVAAVVTFFFLYAILGISFAEGYKLSKRTRYIRKHLIPFLLNKYGVHIAANTYEQSLFIMRSEPVVLRATGKPSTLRFLGWPEIGNVAQTGVANPRLGDAVYLIDQGENEVISELPKIDSAATPSRIFNTAAPKPLEETENGIRSMILDIVTDVPQGRTTLRCMPAAHQEEFGTTAHLKVDAGTDDTLAYSRVEYASFVEAILFNVKMLDAVLILSIVESLDGRILASGIIVKNEGYLEVSAKNLRRMVDEEDSRDIVFVDNVKKMKDAGK